MLRRMGTGTGTDVCCVFIPKNKTTADSLTVNERKVFLTLGCYVCSVCVVLL
jgi:hypothetical protein